MSFRDALVVRCLGICRNGACARDMAGACHADIPAGAGFFLSRGVTIHDLKTAYGKKHS